MGEGHHHEADGGERGEDPEGGGEAGGGGDPAEGEAADAVAGVVGEVIGRAHRAIVLSIDLTKEADERDVLDRAKGAAVDDRREHGEIGPPAEG